jgi:hypothetical protein
LRKKGEGKLKHLIYVSEASNVTKEIIHQILFSSRKNNIKNGITGALIYGSNLYLQFLEGPVDAIDETFSTIKLDSRHSKITILRESSTKRKLFSSWKMRDDSIANWMWSAKELNDGVLQNLSPKEALNVFNNLSRDIDQFI